MSEVVTWDDWPEESFDDPDCKCAALANHFFCPIHGGYDMAFALAQYKRKRSHLFPKQRMFGFMDLEIVYRKF